MSKVRNSWTSSGDQSSSSVIGPSLVRTLSPAPSEPGDAGRLGQEQKAASLRAGHQQLWAGTTFPTRCSGLGHASRPLLTLFLLPQSLGASNNSYSFSKIHKPPSPCSSSSPHDTPGLPSVACWRRLVPAGRVHCAQLFPSPHLASSSR